MSCLGYVLANLDIFQGRDMNELKRHIYSNTVDRSAIKKLLRDVFLPCRCREAQQRQQNQVTQKCTLLLHLEVHLTVKLRCVVSRNVFTD